MVHVGNDFPKPIEDRLQSWDVTLVIERESNQASTRGLLEYKDSTFGRTTYLSSLKSEYSLPYCRHKLLITNLLDVLSTIQITLANKSSSQEVQIHNAHPRNSG